MSPLEAWRESQREGDLLTGDFEATAFYDRVSQNPVRLLREWCGRSPYGRPHEVRALLARIQHAQDVQARIDGRGPDNPRLTPRRTA